MQQNSPLPENCLKDLANDTVILFCSRPPLVKWDFEFLCDKAISKVVGVGSVESSFLYQTCPGIKDFKDPDYAPLLVLVEYLCTVEVSFLFRAILVSK